MASKKRLDVLLTERGMAESRQKAQAIIMAGQVFWDDKRMDKPGVSIPEDANLEIRGQTLKYVSRGGLKLEKAMAQFDLPSLEGAIAIDSGASTGGFTDCMLQNGAAKVYAVDVGYGQLAWSLRQDPRVVCMERTNVRYLTQETIPAVITFEITPEGYVLQSYETPRSGDHCQSDLEKLFSKAALTRLNKEEYELTQKLADDCAYQNTLHSITFQKTEQQAHENKLEEQLAIICSSPAQSSNPGD